MNIPIANFISQKKKKKKEKRGGHMIKCLLTELGRAREENIWPSVMAHGPRCTWSIRHDLGPNIFPSGPPTQSISTYQLTVYNLELPFSATIDWIAIHSHLMPRLQELSHEAKNHQGTYYYKWCWAKGAAIFL